MVPVTCHISLPLPIDLGDVNTSIGAILHLASCRPFRKHMFQRENGSFNMHASLQAPEGAPVSSGVVVEQGESCLYVKVNCRDRRGLLGDIILALKAMPLEVCTVWATSPSIGVELVSIHRSVCKACTRLQ